MSDRVRNALPAGASPQAKIHKLDADNPDKMCYTNKIYSYAIKGGVSF